MGQAGLKRTVADGKGQQAGANSAAKDSKFMNSQLLVAILPWMGNMLLPFSSELKRHRKGLWTGAEVLLAPSSHFQILLISVVHPQEMNVMHRVIIY